MTQTRTKAPLEAWRDGVGLSQAEAAEKVGISQAHWSRIETRDAGASPRLAKKIHDMTGVALDLLMDFGERGSLRTPRTVAR